MRQLYSPVQYRPQTVLTPSTPHPRPSSIGNVHLAMNGSMPNVPLLQRMFLAWRRRRGSERDPLVGLMLAGQQSRPRPGATIRRRRGNWF